MSQRLFKQQTCETRMRPAAMQPVPVNLITPPAEEFFYPDYELPEYNSEVNESSLKNLNAIPQDEYGVAYPQILQMDDDNGTRYKVVRYEASNPRTDNWVVKDTAWGTQPEGLNTDVARKLMSMGFNVMIKGPEIGSSIPLSQSAFHTHKVLDYMNKLGYMNSSAVALEGYSRGSMVGFGTNALAPRFNRDIIYSNFTDPCVAVPVGFNKETAKKAVHLPFDLAYLGIDIAQGLAQPRRGKHLLQTVDASPKGAVQFARTGLPLFNGEAGKLADRTPKDMKATIAFFKACGVNDKKTYKEILRNHHGVRFVTPEGSHGKGIDSRIIGNIAVRFGRLADQLSEGRSREELDWGLIHLRAA